MLAVFGVWATVTGVAQVVVALQRRAVLGNQWPMLVAGGLSALVGLFYIGQALGDDPKLDVLSVYAAGGGAFFVIQSVLLARRERAPRRPPGSPGALGVDFAATASDPAGDAADASPGRDITAIAFACTTGAGAAVRRDQLRGRRRTGSAR